MGAVKKKTVWMQSCIILTTDGERAAFDIEALGMIGYQLTRLNWWLRKELRKEDPPISEHECEAAVFGQTTIDSNLQATWDLLLDNDRLFEALEERGEAS